MSRAVRSFPVSLFFGFSVRAPDRRPARRARGPAHTHTPARIPPHSHTRAQASDRLEHPLSALPYPLKTTTRARRSVQAWPRMLPRRAPHPPPRPPPAPTQRFAPCWIGV